MSSPSFYMWHGGKKWGITDKARASELCIALTAQNSQSVNMCKSNVNTSQENITLPVRGFISLIYFSQNKLKPWRCSLPVKTFSQFYGKNHSVFLMSDMSSNSSVLVILPLNTEYSTVKEQVMDEMIELGLLNLSVKIGETDSSAILWEISL